jgi:HipA-like protein
VQQTLQVFIQGARVGELRYKDDVWSFRYARKWASGTNRYALAPGIPLGKKPIVDCGSNRAVRQYFESLLPHDKARSQLAQIAGVDAADSISLLAYFGAKSSGYRLGDYPIFLQFGPLQKELHNRPPADRGQPSKREDVRVFAKIGPSAIDNTAIAIQNSMPTLLDRRASTHPDRRISDL